MATNAIQDFAWTGHRGMFAREEHDADINTTIAEKGPSGGAMEERRIAAWIGSSIVIKGDLTSSEDTTIAGQVEGDVSVKEHALVIAARARIRGNIVARAVAVHGEVIGTITSEGKVEVGETGSVEGDINAPRMVLSEGAVLRGRLQMSTPAS